MGKAVLDRRASRRAFLALWAQDRRRARAGSGAGGVAYEAYLLANYTSNLVAFFPLAADVNDDSPNGNDAYSSSNVSFGSATPSGFQNENCASFNGSNSQIRLENTTYPFGLERFTIMCWFKKTGAGDTCTTAAGTDGFPGADPVVPLVTKGRGESDGNNRDANWFLGLNRVNNGSTYKLAGDFEHIEVGTPNNHRIVGTTTIADGQWYHAALAFDGTDLKLYLDGALEATVTPGKNPRNDSIQKAGIGTAYTLSAGADGFFAGQIAGVSIWSEALDLTAVAALHSNGNESIRPVITYTVGAEDNAIGHGTDFANWSVDAGSSKSSNGITLVANDDADFAEIQISGLAPSTVYWCRCVIAAENGTVGNLRVIGDSDDFQKTGGGDFDIPAGVGTKYFQLETKSNSSPHQLRLEHNGGTNGASIRFSEFNVYPIPARSSDKIAVLGDRTGGYDANRATSVDNAILNADADTINALQIGDSGDTANQFSINDTLKNALALRSGKIYPCMGNHDYDVTREDEWDDYYGTAGYNGGKTNYARELGNCLIAFYNDNPEEGSNAGGYNASSAAAQEASAMGQWLAAVAAASEKPWKICLIHRGAYSSHTSGGDASNRMNFAGMGFNLVLQAHYHGIERIHRDGIIYYTAAMGGGSHHGWGTQLAESQWRETDQSVSGFLKISDSPGELVLEYFDTNLNLLDRVKVTRVVS